MIRKISAALSFFIALNLFTPAQAKRPAIPIYDKAAAISQICTSGLSEAKTRLDRLQAISLEKAQAQTVFKAWNDLQIVLEDVEGPVFLLNNVSPNTEVRAEAEQCLLRTNVFSTELFLNEKVLERIRRSEPRHPSEAKLKKELIEAFEDTGVTLSAPKRARMKVILQRLEELRQEFSRNIRDNKSKVQFTAAELKGLPADYLQKVKQDEQGNTLLGFDYPEYEPFMANAEDEQARARYQAAFNSRGTPANIEILLDAMRLRREIADLYDLPSYAHYVIRRRMAQDPDKVKRFLAEVKNAVAELEKKELAELRAFKAESLGKSVDQVKFNRWDVSYYQNKLKKARYNIDQETLRRYFPTEASVAWAIHLSSELYGLRFRPATVAVWHPEVRYYDVFDRRSGRLLGGIYLDLYPRAGKYGHAAAFPVRGASKLAKRTPISVLVTNFNRQGLTHDELETLVHEFGHVLHGVLSEAEYITQAGTSVERDFVEAPSQMFEEWARRIESLKLLKKFCRDCPQVSGDIVKQLVKARSFGQGIRYARQHLYAEFDLATHSETIEDPQTLWEKMEHETPLGHVIGTQFPGTFEHIMGGYSAAYYGYMWSEVLALDMLSAYGNNLMNPSVGRHFRDKILARGGTVMAQQMVRDFLGREPNSKAFFAEITGRRN